jgi:UDP-N-acetylmuramate--alanine ligase
VGQAELVVFSAAVPVDNEELAEARRLGLCLVSRAELVGDLSRSRYTIGVAGSHGKTTTTSMVAGILQRAGLDPSVLVGGRQRGRVQAALGKGEFLVVEADEYQRGFHHLHPRVALVTNIDAEHLDCYRDLAEVQDAFVQFLERLPFYGRAVLAGDDPGVRQVLPRLSGERLTYGLGEDSDWRAEQVECRAWGSRFMLVHDGGRLGPIALQVPGEHNVRNAVGAAATAWSVGVHGEAIAAGLQEFAGVARRFEKKGEVRGVLVVDDYAHHPTEVAATLAAARRSGRRVVAVFQPHLYSRTRALAAGFAQALQAADQVFLAPVYPAREAPLPGVQSDLIARAMRVQGYDRVEYVPHLEQMAARLQETCREGDLLLTMGAGDIDQVSAAVVAALQQQGS